VGIEVFATCILPCVEKVTSHGSISIAHSACFHFVVYTSSKIHVKNKLSTNPFKPRTPNTSVESIDIYSTEGFLEMFHLFIEPRDDEELEVASGM